MTTFKQRVIAIIGSRTPNKDSHMRCGQIVGHAFKCLNKNTDIILSGGAGSGADWWARVFAQKYGFRYLEAPAFWTKDDGSPNRGAGLFRNVTIAKTCDIGLAVWDGRSHGTKHGIDSIQGLGKPVWVTQL